MSYERNTGILSWAEEDRPREKLLLKGKSTLTNAELIAILIGSGTASLSAVDVSKIILKSVDNDLEKLALLGVKDLMKFKGIGEAKAISIVSALELGRRRTPGKKSQFKITSSHDVFQYIKPHLMDLLHEEFWVIFLNRANVVLKHHNISSGGLSGTVVDPKVIFKNALENLASSIILIHNHPSGNKKPSSADISLTRKLKSAGEFLEIPILDHIIYTNDGFFSFADEGML
jgi:DNA repair protein RadC